MATWELAGGSLCFRRHKCESGVISNRGISRVFFARRVLWERADLHE